MTKFDKLNQLFGEWYRSTHPTSDRTYAALAAYYRELFPDRRVGIDLGWSMPGAIRGYVTRRDYLGRDRTIQANLTTTGVAIRRDPMTNRVNERLAKNFEHLYEPIEA